MYSNSNSRPYKSRQRQLKSSYYTLPAPVPLLPQPLVPATGRLGFFEGALFKTPAGGEVTGRTGDLAIRKVLQYLDSIPQLNQIGKVIHDAASASRKAWGEDDLNKAFRFVPPQVYAQLTGKSIQQIEAERKAIADAEARAAPGMQTQCTSVCKSRYPGKIMNPRWSNNTCYCNIEYTASASIQSKCVTVCRNKYPGRTMNPRWSNNNCYCNLGASNVTMQSKCATLCKNKYPGRVMNPSWSNNNCYCNLRAVSGGGTGCGTQNGCNEACYKLGNSRYGSGKYRMNPKQSSCTSCSCNFTLCGTQNKCNEACYKLGNSRYGSGKYRMSPKQTSCTSCSCNFVKCGTQSGCERACPSKSGYTKNPRQASCTTCYCNYSKSFRCPYSGCGGTTSKSQCYLCRCRGICNNSRCGGVRTVSSTGGCWCNKSC